MDPNIRWIRFYWIGYFIFGFPRIIGVKTLLVARLSKALKSEETDSILAENQNESNIDESEVQAGGTNSSNEVLDCASNDSMEIDLADIVVIDEYDSTKADKSESRSKRVKSQNILFFTMIFKANSNNFISEFI